MELLVGVPAAVEEALASLMVDPHGPDAELQQRAANTYIRRIYYPYLLGPPVFKTYRVASMSSLNLQKQGSMPGHIRGGGAAGGGGGNGGGNGAPFPNLSSVTTATWLYEDPALTDGMGDGHTSNSYSQGGGDSRRAVCAGGLLLLPHLSQLEVALPFLEAQLEALLGDGERKTRVATPLNLHIAVAGETLDLLNAPSTSIASALQALESIYC